MANYLNFTKAVFNPYNPKVLNEGQFSWFTQDSEEQIGSERENTIDVWMYDNEGNSWYEKRYAGYGEFGGMDYYELLAKMNGYSEEDLEDKKVLKAMSYGKKMRDIGISLAFDKLPTKDKGRKVLFPALVANGKYNWKRHDFTKEAESDPNQSWYQEPEYDEYEEEYYESEKPELTWEGLKESLGLNEAKMDKEFAFIAAETKKHNLLMKIANELFPKIAKEQEGGVFVNFKPLSQKQRDEVYIEFVKRLELDESNEVNEGRSINKISKDHAKVVLDMAKTAGEWKDAEGDRKSDLLEKLRELNKQKAELEKELDDAVAGKDRNLQLSLEEAEELAYLEKDVKNILEENGEEK